LVIVHGYILYGTHSYDPLNHEELGGRRGATGGMQQEEDEERGWAELPEELLRLVLRHLQCDTLGSVSALPRLYDLAGVEWRPSNESFVSQTRLRSVRATCSGWRDVVDGNCRALRLSTLQALEESPALHPGGRLDPALIADLQLPLYAQVPPHFPVSCGGVGVCRHRDEGLASVWGSPQR